MSHGSVQPDPPPVHQVAGGPDRPLHPSVHSRFSALVVGVIMLLITMLIVMEMRPITTHAANTWPGIKLSPIATGLDNPVHITHANDASDRLFVVEQEGTIRILISGALLSDPFLDIRDKVSCCGERGLLSMAFAPDHPVPSHFYVNYTNNAGHTIIARYAVDATNPNQAIATSEQIMLQIDQPFANHNGGQIAFGPDGYLYIGMGDGGSAGDPDGRAQNRQELLGKLLRIDVEAGGDAPYIIPATNPFTQTVDYRPEIWAFGLRNPWRFSFDRATGDLYIADVGQNAYEEVNVQPATSPGGQNYGWDIMEGLHCYNADACDRSGLTMPVIEYPHTQGNTSITGGFVYRGTAYPNLAGIYFYADYVSGRIWGLRQNGANWEHIQLYDAPFLLSTFGEDRDGNLFVADYSNGVIYEIINTQILYLPLVQT